MNGLQTVAYIGQSAPDYDRHRIFDKRGLDLFLYVNVGDFLRLVGGIIDFVVHKNSNILMPDADHISTFSAYLALFSMY